MQKLVIKGSLAGMNEIIRANRINRYQGGIQKTDYTKLVQYSVLEQTRKRYDGKVYITLTYYEPNNRRDDDNVHAGAKFILDGLVAAKVIVNDNRRYVSLQQNAVLVDRENPRIEILIEERK